MDLSSKVLYWILYWIDPIESKGLIWTPIWVSQLLAHPDRERALIICARRLPVLATKLKPPQTKNRPAQVSWHQPEVRPNLAHDQWPLVICTCYLSSTRLALIDALVASLLSWAIAAIAHERTWRSSSYWLSLSRSICINFSISLEADLVVEEAVAVEQAAVFQ